MRCTPPITSSINKYPIATIHLVKFLCEVFRIATDKQPPEGMGESFNLSHIRFAVKRDGDVESLRAGRLHPAWKPDFLEQVGDLWSGMRRRRRSLNRPLLKLRALLAL